MKKRKKRGERNRATENTNIFFSKNCTRKCSNWKRQNLELKKRRKIGYALKKGRHLEKHQK